MIKSYKINFKKNYQFNNFFSQNFDKKKTCFSEKTIKFIFLIHFFFTKKEDKN